jgi:carbon storage regulator
MLVLSRKESERIKLGDSIVVTVVRVSGGKVRLGIEAPADMVILRDELSTRPAPTVDLAPLESGFAPEAGIFPPPTGATGFASAGSE